MPTYAVTARFRKDLAMLDPSDRSRFRRAVEQLVEDLSSPGRRPRAGLRVKGVRGADGVFEMTWARDGRATFEYGDEQQVGEPHVIWRRIGTPDIFGRP